MQRIFAVLCSTILLWSLPSLLLAQKAPKWLTKVIHPIQINQVEDPQLQAFASEIKQRRLLLVGAQLHGSQEMLQTQNALFKILVEQHGWRNLAYENGYHYAMKVERLLNAPELDEKALMNNNYWWHYNQDTKDLLLWIREWNQAHPEDKIRLRGIHIHRDRTSMDYLFERVGEADAKLGAQIKDLLKDYYAHVAPTEETLYKDQPAEAHANAAQQLQKVIDVLQEQRSTLVAQLGEAEAADLIQLAQHVKATEPIVRGVKDRSKRVLASMADVINQTADQAGAEAHTMVLLHNFYAPKEPMRFAGGNRIIWDYVGAQVQRAYKDQVAVLGLIAYEGQSGLRDGSKYTLQLEKKSHEAALYAAQQPSYWLDVKLLPDSYHKKDRAIRNVLESKPKDIKSEFSHKSDLVKEYDYLIYISSSTAVERLPSE